MKHVLVVIDNQEMSASRKNDATDLVTLWRDKVASVINVQDPQGESRVNYQIATSTLPVGDVWICVSDEPFFVPHKNRLPWFPYPTPSCEIGSTTKNAAEEDLLDLDLYTASGEFNAMTTTNAEEDDFATALGLPTSMSVSTRTPSGDVAKFPPKATIVIERKALADLQSSYNDGRYKDQKARLINCDAPVVMLLVEGYKGSKIKNAVSKQRFLSTFVHCAFRDGIQVYHTACIEDSLDWIEWVAHEMAAGKLERSEDYMERTKYTDNIQMTKKANLTTERGLEMQLASVPGISAKMARAVCAKYPSMMALCAAYEACTGGDQEREWMLADLSFRGPSGKEQRLATRSVKIYHYLAGSPIPADAKPPSKSKAKKKAASASSSSVLQKAEAPKRKKQKTEEQVVII